MSLQCSNSAAATNSKLDFCTGLLKPIVAIFCFINQSVKFDKKLTVGSLPDGLACEQALHLGLVARSHARTARERRRVCEGWGKVARR